MNELENSDKCFENDNPLLVTTFHNSIFNED